MIRIRGAITFITDVFGNPAVLALFARQHWVASARQLNELQVSEKAIRSACSIELIERVTGGVYRVASAPLGFEGRCMALLLKSPPGSFISGPTAGRLYGLRKMPAVPVEITVPWNVRRTLPPWARKVRSDMDAFDQDVVQRPDGIVVSSPLRTLFRLAGLFNQFRFERVAEDMWHLGLVSPREAAAYLGDVRRSGRTGVARMERWLARTEAIERPSESGLEQALVELTVSAGLPEPVRQYPLTLLNGVTIHVDMAWPDIRFGLEPGHSWWHGGDLRQRADQARDRACTEIGWHVVRYDEESTKEPGLATQVRRMFEQRSLLVTGRPWPDASPPIPPAA